MVTGPGEQPLPGLAGSGRATVIVPGGPGAGPVTWTAAVSRVEPGSGEWDEVIGPLVAGRLHAVLAQPETSPARRWGQSGWAWGLMVYAPAGQPLDHPDLEPFYAAAAEFDLAVVLSSWGPCVLNLGCEAELDTNGVVDAADLAIVLGGWGPVPIR